MKQFSAPYRLSTYTYHNNYQYCTSTCKEVLKRGYEANMSPYGLIQTRGLNYNPEPCRQLLFQAKL